MILHHCVLNSLAYFQKLWLVYEMSCERHLQGHSEIPGVFRIILETFSASFYMALRAEKKDMLTGERILGNK